MISRTSWAREAANRSSSVSAHISSPLELWTMMLRTCSPISVPPGSRVGDDLAPGCLQLLREVRDLRGFAAAFRTLERDEDAAVVGPARAGTGARYGLGRLLCLFHGGKKP